MSWHHSKETWIEVGYGLPVEDPSIPGKLEKYTRVFAEGMVDGVPKIETHLEWQVTPHTDPSWNIKGCYITQIQGDPCVYNKHMIFPKPGSS